MGLKHCQLITHSDDVLASGIFSEFDKNRRSVGRTVRFEDVQCHEKIRQCFVVSAVDPNFSIRH